MWAAVAYIQPPELTSRKEQDGRLVARPGLARAQVQREQGRAAGSSAA